MTETEIRRVLLSHLASMPGADGAAFISEMFLESFSRRADLVMANGSLAAFEIKSERDTLIRLSGQLASYLRLFEQVTVVCAARHVEGVMHLAEHAVGVWAVDERGQVNVVRRAKSRRILSRSSWLSFVPVDELRVLIKASGQKAIGTRQELMERAQFLPLRYVREYVLSYLKRRDKRIRDIVSRRAATQSNSAGLKFDVEERVRAFLANGAHVKAIPRKIS